MEFQRHQAIHLHCEELLLLTYVQRLHDIAVDVYGHWIIEEDRDEFEDALQPAQWPDVKCIMHM